MRTYEVKSFMKNPRLNKAVGFHNKRKALEYSKRISGDDPASRVTLSCDGIVFAYRNITQSRLSHV